MTNGDVGRLGGSVAVVTGAASGIGRAVATRLAHEGAGVVVFDRHQSQGTAVADELVAKGLDAMAMVGDVTHQQDLDRAVAAAAEHFGAVPDIVVCNAGEQTFTGVWDLSDAEWRTVMETNAYGTFLTLRSFSAAMKAAGKPGSMVAIASVKGRMGAPLYAHYSASKAAVLSLTKSFALELAGDRVRVNSVAPGAIRTPLWERASQEMGRLLERDPEAMRTERISEIPLGRFGEPEDVAGAVGYLVSPEASYVTGECIHVCGGDFML